MPKQHSEFICSTCGNRSPRAFKLCPQCGAFDTMQEHKVEAVAAKAKSRTSPKAKPQLLQSIHPRQQKRIHVPIDEFNRVLGGGFVPGSLVLLGGEPGIGKSTLVLKVSAQLAQAGAKVLYVSGEESAQQIKLRADRLGISAPRLYLLTTTDLGEIIEQAKALEPTLLVVDSIQTTQESALTAAPGLVAQVRHCARKLQEMAKASALCILLIGHVTKDGNIAGPRLLEHIVDAVLTLDGDPFQHYRLLRAVKNRFGATSEVGVFEMQGRGLVPVENPSAAFLEQRLISASGSAIAVTMEGTRPLLVELQALASPTSFANPRRTPNGVDMNRLLLLSAVMSKRMGLKLWQQDLFVNVVGGMKISEPAADLAMALAIASSYYDRPLPADWVIVGEVGLSGEIRRASQLAARLHEAQNIGFKHALIPRLGRRREALPAGMQLVQARSLDDALRALKLERAG